MAIQRNLVLNQVIMTFWLFWFLRFHLKANNKVPKVLASTIVDVIRPSGGGFNYGNAPPTPNTFMYSLGIREHYQINYRRQPMRYQIG